MRAPILTLLVLAAFAAPAAAKSLPRGDDRFTLGMTRPELDLRISERRVEKLAIGRNSVAIGSDDPAVEFERYTVLPMKAKDVVAEVTITCCILIRPITCCARRSTPPTAPGRPSGRSADRASGRTAPGVTAGDFQVPTSMVAPVR